MKLKIGISSDCFGTGREWPLSLCFLHTSVKSKREKGKSLTSNCPGGSAPGKESNSCFSPNQSLCFPLRILIVIAFLSWNLPTRNRSDATNSLPKAQAETGHQISKAFTVSLLQNHSSLVYDTVQMRTPQTVLFFVRCMEKAEGFMSPRTKCRAVYHALTSATSSSLLDCTGW